MKTFWPDRIQSPPSRRAVVVMRWLLEPASGSVIAKAMVPPGVTTRWHFLAGTAERYVILEGRGRVEVGDLAPREVGPGDVVLIPPECRQRIANLGAGELVFLAICTPRFRMENYRDAE